MRREQASFQAAVREIRHWAEKAIRHVGSMTLEEFVADDRTADAVMGDTIIVGEAAKRAIEASPELESKHPELRLREGRSLRNETVHEYEKIDLEDLFVTVGETLRPMAAAAREFLGEQPMPEADVSNEDEQSIGLRG